MIYLAVLAGLLILAAVYFWILRPRILPWGATPEEVEQPLPGDDVVQKPHFLGTRAVTNTAPASETWN